MVYFFMAKKKKYRPKGPIQILAAIGLVIAILWTAKGLFQFGDAGYKEIKNKVSNRNSLPVLKCVTNDNGKDFEEIIDLERIKADQGSEDSIRKRVNMNDANFIYVTVSEDEYLVRYVNNVRGMMKGYMVSIFRDSGVIEYRFTPPISVSADVGAKIQSLYDAKVARGICTKIERKKL